MRTDICSGHGRCEVCGRRAICGLQERMQAERAKTAQNATTQKKSGCGVPSRPMGISKRTTGWKRFPASRLVHKDLALLYDGSLEGLFSAVYLCFSQKLYPSCIEKAERYQGSLLDETLEVQTDIELAERVRLGIYRAFGRDEYERIRAASLSDETDAGTTIFRYLVYAYDKGPGCWHNLTVPEVDKFERLWNYVYNERHKMLQFARFSKMENGVYFAKINPRANVVPLVMGHFASRFNVQPFLVYDEVHHIAGIWDQQRISFVETSDITLPALDEHDRMYQQLWKLFYDRICNVQRLNPALRRSFMPVRLMRNITEMDDRLATPRHSTQDARVTMLEATALELKEHV